MAQPQPSEEWGMQMYRYNSSSITDSYQSPEEPSMNTDWDDYPRPNDQGWSSFECLYPGCDAQHFEREADLERHYLHAHRPELRDNHLCDYPKCHSSRGPFHRLDHYREHLRDYHREDIPKRGTAADENWLAGRYADPTWWRCSKCLIRVYIADSKFKCPGCKKSCEPVRQEGRRSWS